MDKLFSKFKSDNKEVFPWLGRRVKPYVFGIVSLSVINALIAFVGAANAYVSKFLMDSATAGDRQKLIKFVIIGLATMLFLIVMRVVSSLLNSKLEIDMEKDFRSYFIRNLFNKDYLKITSYHSGDLMTRLTNDNGCIISGLVGIFPSLIGLVFRIVCAFFALYFLDKRLAIIFGCFGILVFIFTRLSRSFLKRFYHRIQKSESAVRSFAQEIIENILVVSVFDASSEVSANADKLLETNARNRWSRTKFFTFGTGTLSIAFRSAYMAVCILCAFKLLNGDITYGTITALLSLVTQLQTPFKNLSGLLPTYYQMLASTERILEIIDIEGEKSEERVDPESFYASLKSIDFDNVSFSYGRDEVLENASVSVRKGDFVAITGISGIGKSTMLKMLLSVIEPSGGEISFDTENGKVAPDIAHRSLFSYVPQGNMLLSGTIKENVTFMMEDDKSEEEFRRALRLSCSEDFVSELPDGAETVIGERGRGLSEGQTQRLAIARAILRDAPIILLDEATSALDEATEERVLKNLKSVEGCTCIIVSHKKAALKVCNKEIRIEDKKFVERDIDENED